MRKELIDQIKFAETLVHSAQLTLDSFEGRLEDLNKERAKLDEQEAQLRRDVERAPALLARAQENLAALHSTRKAITAASGRYADPATARKKLEVKRQRHERLAAELERIEQELTNG